jgi:hypothetical protein
MRPTRSPPACRPPLRYSRAPTLKSINIVIPLTRVRALTLYLADAVFCTAAFQRFFPLSLPNIMFRACPLYGGALVPSSCGAPLMLIVHRRFRSISGLRVLRRTRGRGGYMGSANCSNWASLIPHAPGVCGRRDHGPLRRTGMAYTAPFCSLANSSCGIQLFDDSGARPSPSTPNSADVLPRVPLRCCSSRPHFSCSPCMF